MTSRSRQYGVGLIEILVAVLVLSIGILGLGALQTRALADNGSAMNQSMATLASYSILEAMRADQTNALAGSYNQTVTANACGTSANTNTLAQNQLVAWCSMLGLYLGATASTTGTVACTAADLCKITIQFDDSKGTGGSTQTVVTQAGL
ncbi:MAG: type IV pilus modification protein PilV [Stenotrophobium sp.]